MKAIDKTVIRIRAEDAKAAALWTLPSVKSKHVIGLHEKEQIEESVTIEDEIVAEKITLTELEKIREDAYREGLAEGRAEGVSQGLEEGREKGRQEGLLSGQALVEQKVEVLEAMIKELDLPLLKLDAQLESLVVDLVVSLSRSVVRHELSQITDVIQAAVKEAVEQLPHGSAEVKISVNPQDADLLQDMLRENEHWVLQEDPALIPGGCRVKTNNTVVDNRVETRFESAAQQLLQALGQVSESDDTGAGETLDQGNPP